MRKAGFGTVVMALLVSSCGREVPLHVAQVGPAVGTDILASFGPGSLLAAPLLPPGLAAGGGASVSADGRWLAYQVPAFDSWDIYLFDTATGQINTLPNLNSQRAEVNPIISPDGLAITFLSNRNGFWDSFVYDRVHGTYRPLTFSYFAAFGALPGVWGGW
jgi:hypothetical protein